jgi:hypothetical protein
MYTYKKYRETSHSPQQEILLLLYAVLLCIYINIRAASTAATIFFPFHPHFTFFSFWHHHHPFLYTIQLYCISHLCSLIPHATFFIKRPSVSFLRLFADDFPHFSLTIIPAIHPSHTPPQTQLEYIHFSFCVSRF